MKGERWLWGLLLGMLALLLGIVAYGAYWALCGRP